MSAQPAKLKFYDYYLLRLTAILAGFGFSFWLPDIHESFWLRRLFVYLAGFLALGYVWLHHRRLSMRPVYWWPLCTLIVVSSIALFNSPNFINGLIGQPVIHPSLLSFYACLSVGLVVAILPNKQKLTVYIYYLVVGFALLNLINWLFWHKAARLGSLGGQINYTAYLFVIALVIGAWLRFKRFFRVKWLIIAQSLLFLCIFLTQSRTAIILALIIQILWLVKTLISNRVAGLMIAVITLAVIISGLTLQYFERLHKISYLDDSRNYRWQLIQSAMPSSVNKLWLGGGVGSIEANVHQRGPHYPLIKVDLDSGWRFESSHNFFVDIMIERGIVVLGLFLWLLAAALWRGRKSVQPDHKLLFYVLLTSLLFLIFNNVNIQQEVIVWACLLGLLINPKTIKA